MSQDTVTCFACLQTLETEVELIVAELRRRHGNELASRATFHTTCFRVFKLGGGRRPGDEGAYDVVTTAPGTT